MTMNRGRKAVMGLALLVGAGAMGVAGAHGMMGMMGGGQSGAMQDCPMMGSSAGGMQGMHGGGMGMAGGGMHGGGMGMMQKGGMGMPGGGMHGPKGMMAGVELNDEQQEKLRELRSERRHEQFARKADMLDLRDEMHALMAEQQPDPDAVRELHGRMADLHGDMLAEHVRMRNEMRGMLTDEQRQQMHQRGEMAGPGKHHGGSSR